MKVANMPGAALLMLVALLGSCHSLSRIRLSQEVRTEGAATVLELWVDAPGPVVSDPPHITDVLTPLVLYPLDKLLSFYIAVTAPFDGDLDVQWEPVGALVGCTLPWVTLMPYVFPPSAPPDVELTPATYAQLITRIEAGDGVRAYVEIVGLVRVKRATVAPQAVAVLKGEPPRIQMQFAREPPPLRPDQSQVQPAR